MTNGNKISNAAVLACVAFVAMTCAELQAAPPVARPAGVVPRPVAVARHIRQVAEERDKPKKVPSIVVAGTTPVVVTTGTSEGTTSSGSSGTSTSTGTTGSTGTTSQNQSANTSTSTGTTAQTTSTGTGSATGSTGNSGTTNSLPVADATATDFSGATSYKVLRIEENGYVAVIEVDGKECRVRMLGLAAIPAQKKDGPVSAKTNSSAQKYAETMLKGESVYVVYDGTLEEKDEDNNYVAYLYRAPDGLAINVEMIRQGYAAADLTYSYEQQETFKVYQLRASENQKGLWSKTTSSQAATPTSTGQSQVAKNSTSQAATK